MRTKPNESKKLDIFKRAEEENGVNNDLYKMHEKLQSFKPDLSMSCFWVKLVNDAKHGNHTCILLVLKEGINIYCQ